MISTRNHYQWFMIQNSGMYIILYSRLLLQGPNICNAVKISPRRKICYLNFCEGFWISARISVFHITCAGKTQNVLLLSGKKTLRSLATSSNFCKSKWCLQILQIFGPHNNNPLYGIVCIHTFRIHFSMFLNLP